MGKLKLVGMSFYGYHGVSSAEKELGTRFEVDVELEIDTKKPAETGKLIDTLNYELVYKLVQKHMTEKKYHLLENLAETLADEIVNQFKPSHLALRVRKISPPFPSNLNYVELEVTR